MLVAELPHCDCNGDPEAHQDSAEAIWADGRRDQLPPACEYFGGPEESAEEIAPAWFFNPDAMLMSADTLRLYRLLPDVFWTYCAIDDVAEEDDSMMRGSLDEAVRIWLTQTQFFVEGFTGWPTVVERFVDGDVPSRDTDDDGIPVEDVDPDSYRIGVVGVTLSDEVLASLRADAGWRT